MILETVHDVLLGPLVDGIVAAYPLAILGLVALSYVSGPGWLPHDPCPHCCWCDGSVPFGERAEARAREWLSRRLPIEAER